MRARPCHREREQISAALARAFLADQCARIRSICLTHVDAAVELSATLVSRCARSSVSLSMSHLSRRSRWSGKRQDSSSRASSSAQLEGLAPANMQGRKRDKLAETIHSVS